MARSWTITYSGADWWEDGFDDDMNFVRKRRKTHFAEDRGGPQGGRPQKQKHRSLHRGARPVR